MSFRIGLLCIVLAASLGGCAQNSGMAQLTQLLPGGEPSDDLSADEASADEGEGPPIPVRNARRASGGDGGSAGEQQQAGLSLPSLADVNLFTASAYAPDTTRWEAKPVAVYTRLAKRIRACWLTPGAPKLENHGFHAEIGSTEANEAKIILYQKADNNGRGLMAYTLDIEGNLSGSVVKARNRRVEEKLDQDFRSDLVRWSKGDESCKS